MNENFSQTPSVDVNEGSFFSFKGICSVKKYWLHFLISLAVVLLDYGYYFFIKNPPHWLDVVETVVYIVFLIVWNIHLICLGVQRFRATGHNPWTMLIPIYSSIIIKFLPSCKDQSKNKYLNYTIPAEKLLRVLLIIISIIPNSASIRETTQTIHTDISKIRSGRVVFSTDEINCKQYYTDDGNYYYFDIYRYDGNIIDTLVFSKPKTLRFLKKQYIELKQNNPENYMDAFINKIKDLYYDRPALELYDANGESIIHLEPYEYVGAIDEIIDEYNPKIIRLWYEAFDSVVEEDFLAMRKLYEENINE
ncbi:DUF805 domain-containing protein [Treponema sp.]|uniref:DUF805 domain-containing protein n=1 Tax=Treponema sp. TaxID=166 RepID=UPI0025EEFC8F|nr:DUF805 domain-containing protein [Treponema sp.]MBR4323668.1 DUF805 domain-containing protein [Treponema sp.]